MPPPAAALPSTARTDPDPTREPPSVPLPFRRPYDWRATLDYLGGRATPGVEAVSEERGGCYRRALRVEGRVGVVTIRAAAGGRSLRAEVSATLLPVLPPLVARLRRLLDLDADARRIAQHFAHDPRLAPLVARRPGLRVPGAVDGFELALRTVLGQQVSVRGATRLAARLADEFGDPLPEELRDATGIERLPVTAERLAGVRAERVATIGLPRARAACVVSLARAVVAGELPELAAVGPVADPTDFIRRFTALPGIGKYFISGALNRD